MIDDNFILLAIVLSQGIIEETMSKKKQIDLPFDFRYNEHHHVLLFFLTQMLDKYCIKQ